MKNTKESAHEWLKEHYGLINGEKIWKLWHRRARDTITKNQLDIRKRIHPDWQDYKAFAAYIIRLDNFDLWPIYQFDRIDDTLSYGYCPGNIRFIPMKENVRNASHIKRIKYLDKEYLLTEFVEEISGITGRTSVYTFVYNCIFIGNCTVIHTMNKLYERRNKVSFWPSLAVKEYFLTWYGNQVSEQLERRANKRYK